MTRSYYVIFGLYLENGEWRYRAVFPFAKDNDDAKTKAKKFFREINLRTKLVDGVGPIDINEIPRDVKRFHLIRHRKIKGYIHNDWMLYDRPWQMTSSDIIHDLKSDWKTNVDMI